MSTENIVETETDDLDLFASEFFGQKEEAPEPASSEEEDTDDQESDAPNEDTHVDEDDTLAPDDDDEPEEEEEEAPKPKKNRFQERIDELTGKQREAERRAKDLEDKLNEAIQKLNQQNETKPTPKVEIATGPKPTDVNEDGTDKYPLGEFDPNFITDLADYRVEQRLKAIEDKREADRRQQEVQEQQSAIQAEWQEKLAPAQERYPDFAEKTQSLESVFEGIDQQYGEYLAATVMSLDNGPDVLYYLSNHPDEAMKIVNSGATKATLALGKIDAKFEAAEEEKQKARPKVSKAPEPPAHLAKGNVAAKIDVPDDTDDLDAFAEKLFKRRK